MMSMFYEPKYPVLGSVEELLAPKKLSDLLSTSITRVDKLPINGHTGLAGGELSYVDTNAGRFVLKRMSIASDWIMFASDDRLCRSVTLWQYGCLDQLLPHLEHRILACSRDNEGWAILMDDLTGYVYSRDKSMAPDLVPTFIDGLAKIHATFWINPHLRDPRLGLCDPAKLLDQSSLPMAQKHEHLSMGVIPSWVRGGWEIMEDLLDPDVFGEMRNLIENPLPLFDALISQPYTLLHGDYRAENLAHLEHPIAIDWQESTCSLMTIDLAWFAKQGFVLATMGQEKAINLYRERLETYLSERFDDARWQTMVDLGYLFDALRSTCFAAYWYKHSPDPEGRRFNEIAVKMRNQQVRDALRWL